MKNQLVIAAIALVAAACSSAQPAHQQGVLKRLDSQLSTKEESTTDRVTYVAAFTTNAEASAHAAAVLAAGGTAVAVGGESRLLKVKATRASLAKVNLDDQAIVTLNTRVRLVPESQVTASLAAQQVGDPAQAFLTARKVVGVDDLLARFPEADGRDRKVAVFDTGVDFGVEGLSDSDKLQGFYDFTGFGKVAPQTLDGDGSPRVSYEIGDKTVTFALGVAPSRITATGLLSEKDLANSYLWGGFADLNGDQKETVYPYLVGLNRDGTPAVWIDADGNGIIDNAEREELTDFNTTHRHIDLAPGNGMAGAHPLAVSLDGPNGLQFHAIVEGHGTSCSIIIAGDGYANGRLKGMAPKAKIFAYVLDAEGQDVYTVDQFLATFLHAKAQGVNAISISWGFSTADLASARFIGDFLDREIASAGIVIGIAAGNGGPGLNTGAADDYVPHQGFAVGAHISSDQARNIYGWTGITGDNVIHYSSIGPTIGGRLVPDVVSPLMTLVRAQRDETSSPFHGFGGTSSATPALIGAVTALSSALIQQGEPSIDARLLKLAVQASASNVVGVDALRQGAGLINVNAAFDVYKRLAAEQRAAAADQTHRTPFAYELRAETNLPGLTLKGEGIHLKGVTSAADVKVKLTDASIALIDPLTFVEPVALVHSGTFFQIPDLLTLQANGAGFTLRFDTDALANPGTYADVIEVKRLSDHLTLARIPVVVESPAALAPTGAFATVNQPFGPFDIWRLPVDLDHATAIRFDGLAIDLGGNRNARVNVAVASADGRYAFLQATPILGASQTLSIQTEVLPQGHYELLVYRTFPVNAALGSMTITGAFRVPAAAVRAVSLSADKLKLAVEINDNLDVRKAVLTVTADHQVAVLTRNDAAARKGFYGTLNLPFVPGALSIGLRQDLADHALEGFQDLETTISDATTNESLFRGWVEVSDGQPLGAADLSRMTDHLAILAYPNIVNWASVQTQTLWLDVDMLLAEPLVRTSTEAFVARDGQLASLNFPATDGTLALPASGRGEVELFGAAGQSLAKVAVSW